MASVVIYAVFGDLYAATLVLTRSPWAALAAGAVSLAAAAGHPKLCWPLAAGALDARRENLAMVAQGR
jgi:hypothetical protein